MGTYTSRLFLEQYGYWERSAVAVKIDDYQLSKLSNEAENFKEDVSNIINYGKYSAQVVSNTPPSWTARNGEFVFFASGTLKRLYFYNISAWDYIEYNAGATGGLQNSIVSSDVGFTFATIITGLTFNIGISETYTFEIFIADSSSGLDTQNFNINAPGGSTLTALYTVNPGSGNISQINQIQRITALDTWTGNFFAAATNLNILTVTGVLQTGATSSGALTFSARQTAQAGGVGTIFAGSYISSRKTTA